MRRWLALFVGVAAVAVAGTALALTGPAEDVSETVVSEKTVSGEVRTPQVEEGKRTDEVEEAKEIEGGRPILQDPWKETMLVKQVVDSTEKTSPPQDVTAPRIAILYPENGQVFEHREVVFEGSTEPGASVYAGKWRADVGEDGAWRIVLYLSPGHNAVTLKAVDPSGNHATDTVDVVYVVPEKEAKDHQPQDTEEKPKEDKVKEEPKDHEIDWEFVAHQRYGECGETPPFDVFYGKGKPGSFVKVVSEHGGRTVEVGEHGEWEVEVVFETAPVGETFAVKVKDEYGSHKVFEFVHTG